MANSIRYKLRVEPEDFRVEEECALIPETDGPFGIYRLQKRGWNSVDLLQRLAKQLGVRYTDIAYGGRKDRHALTTQYITIAGDGTHRAGADHFQLEYLGRVGETMKPSHITANRFAITLRAVWPKERPVLERNLKQVEAYGLPNYFDDQRFGSYDPRQGFLAQHALLGEWEAAVRLDLTFTRPADRRALKARRRHFAAHWGDWGACAQAAQTGTERRVFAALKAAQKPDFHRAFKLLPTDDISFAFSAYQSHLWNATLAAYLHATLPAEKLCETKGTAGPYVFFRDQPPEELEGEQSVPGRDDWNGPKPLLELLRQKIQQEGLEPDKFGLNTPAKSAMNSYMRPLLLRPAGLALTDSAPDAKYRDRIRLQLRFTLPRGSFATMLIKRLTML